MRNTSLLKRNGNPTIILPEKANGFPSLLPIERVGGGHLIDMLKSYSDEAVFQATKATLSCSGASNSTLPSRQP